MFKSVRRKIGDLVRSIGLYPAYERLYYLAKYRQPISFSFDDMTIPLWLDGPSLHKFLGSFAKNEGPFLRFLLSHLPSGACVWDIGSNSGVFSLLFAKHLGSSGKVYAFEPERCAFARLQANLRLAEAETVVPMKLALGRIDGETTLRIIGKGEHSIVAQQRSGSALQTISMRRGDSLVNEGLSVPQAIKIDVEGAEFDVLEGLEQTIQNPVVQCIAIELHVALLAGQRADPLEDLKGVITRFGFRVCQTIERGTEIHVLCARESSH